MALSDEWMPVAGARPHVSPLETSSSSTTPLAPRLTVTTPSGSCDAAGLNTPTHFPSARSAPGRGGHEPPDPLPERRLDLGAVHELSDVRRADLLLALGDQHEVHGRLFPRAADRVQRREERCLGPLLVPGAAAHDHLAEALLVHDPCLERRRGPLRRVELLDVVHEVEPDSLRGARIEHGEHARLAVGGHDRDRLKARVAKELRHALGSRGGVEALGRDRRERAPVLKSLHGLVVALGDLALDGGEVVRGAGGARGRGRERQDEECGNDARAAIGSGHRSLRGPGTRSDRIPGWGGRTDRTKRSAQSTPGRRGRSSGTGGRGSRGRRARERGYPNRSDRGSQKGSSRPIARKIPRISAACGRRETSSRRDAYQVVAIVQSWSMVTSGRSGTRRASHHARTLSSDRKKSMFAQVKTRSSHHCDAGTRQWNSHVDGSGPSMPTSRTSGSPDSSHRECTRPGRWSAAGTPRASHAQLAKYVVPPTSTRCCVGTPENGGAMRIEAPSASSSSRRWPRRS